MRGFGSIHFWDVKWLKNLELANVSLSCKPTRGGPIIRLANATRGLYGDTSRLQVALNPKVGGALKGRA